MMRKPYTFLVFGRSGCGKGTQAKKLIEHFGLKLYISTGDLFRELVKTPTVAGKKISKILDEGGLPEEWIAAFLWQRELVEKLESPDDGIVFDGLVRRLPEAKALDEVLSWLERDLLPILIDVTREEAFRRLKLRGRADDTEEKINNRLDWYETEVMQTVNYYEKSGRLMRVDGMPSPDKVFENILSHLS